MNEKDLSRALKEVYTPLTTALKELEKRRTNKALRKKVATFLKDFPAEFFSEEPKVVLVRSIITPNRELFHFLKKIRPTGLTPLLLEYNSKFVAKNPEKYHLCRPHYHVDDTEQYRTEKIVNFNTNEGKNMYRIPTTKGVSLYKYHHKLLQNTFPNLCTDNVFEFTKWFNSTRVLDETYYFYYLSIFLVQGILFENFLVQDKEEREFFITKGYPAFKKVCKEFGVKPLIVRLLPKASESDPQWLHYDGDIKKLLY